MIKIFEQQTDNSGAVMRFTSSRYHSEMSVYLESLAVIICAKQLQALLTMVLTGLNHLPKLMRHAF